MSVIEDAIRAGKFPESRRAHYERLMQRDPDGTRKLIASLVAVPETSRARAEVAPLSPLTSDSGRRVIASPLGGYTIEGANDDPSLM